jgi:hypothetical protein
MQEYGGHGEEKRSSFARGSMSPASYHEVVHVRLEPNRGRNALLALLRAARSSFCERARREVLVRDIETHASGQGGQLLADSTDFLLGQLAYASVGGVLFREVRPGPVSIRMWDSRSLVLAEAESE